MLDRMRNKQTSPRVDVRVHLHNDKTYTSQDRVIGVVTLTAMDDRPVLFGKLDIELIGISTFTVKTVSASTGKPVKLDHHERFLELEQTNAMSRAPSDRILRPRIRYKIPFDFTVPNRILATACGHEGRIHGEHTQLPPTLEDSSEGPQRSCTERTTIRYRVVARLWEATDDQDRARRALIAIKSIKIHIVPSAATNQTVTASTPDEFALHQELRLKARTSGKDNRLFISATEPRPLVLDLSEGVGVGGDTTTLPITLHFDGADEFACPPRIGTLKLEFQVETLLSSGSLEDAYWGQSGQQPTKTIGLLSWPAADITWNKHCLGLGDCEVHDDLLYTASPMGSYPSRPKSQGLASKKCSHSSCYRAHLTIPVILPQINGLAPSFQTCSIWRRYRLVCSLDIHCRSMGRAKTILLQVPLRIAMQSPAGRRDSHHSCESCDSSLDMPESLCTRQDTQDGIQTLGEDDSCIEHGIGSDLLPEYTARGYGRNEFQVVRRAR